METNCPDQKSRKSLCLSAAKEEGRRAAGGRLLFSGGVSLGVPSGGRFGVLLNCSDKPLCEMGV